MAKKLVFGREFTQWGEWIKKNFFKLIVVKKIVYRDQPWLLKGNIEGFRGINGTQLYEGIFTFDISF